MDPKANHQPGKGLLGDIPRGDATGFRRYFRYDFVAGLQVFLIALPLCIAISLSSGYPPLAGIFTAIVGSILTSFISNAELTIKGPAAGMIVIALGCVEAFHGDGFANGITEADMLAYRSALAVGVVAAVIQILFGVFRAGILGDFFPTSVVHGMLAAIGVIIISKQIPVALGVPAKGEPLELLREIPHFVMEANPAVATIGLVSLAIMFAWPLVRARVPALKPVPGPLVVLLVAVPLGMYFDLLHPHKYAFHGHEYPLGDQFLVKMPDRPFGMFNEIAFPEFSALAQPVAWKWVAMFFLVGTLETLLSAKAVEMLDPWKRKTNLDRDVIAVGTANLAVQMIGGLPMISEIVRSRANVDAGARTRFSNMWHGWLLLVCVALVPMWLHRIPLAALAAMLVYTGFRLAHPSEFVHVYRIGREQLLIFAATLVAVLATDLVIGIAVGIAVKMVIHRINGVSLRAMFKPYLEVEDVNENTSRIVARESAVFSNWIPFRRQIEQIGLVQRRNLIIDVSNAQLVDHSVMEKLKELKTEFDREGLGFTIEGAHSLRPFSQDATAARKQGLVAARRLTVIAAADLEGELERELVALGASGFTAIPCRGAGRREIENGGLPLDGLVRIEVIAPAAASEAMLLYLRRHWLGVRRVTACLEPVDVIDAGVFLPTAMADGKLLAASHAGSH